MLHYWVNDLAVALLDGRTRRTKVRLPKWIAISYSAPAHVTLLGGTALDGLPFWMGAHGGLKPTYLNG
ncbi:MAG: hypothetical protein LBI14_11390 [Treponema sp.]|nr:hypothetical protein [Treponema sp.]